MISNMKNAAKKLQSCMIDKGKDKKVQAENEFILKKEYRMPKEVEPKDTSRAAAYELWMKAPNPMVTFFKTLDVTNLIRAGRKRHLKFNMLMDYCIGRAAVTIKEFYILPVGDKLIQYDTHVMTGIYPKSAWLSVLPRSQIQKLTGLSG